MTPSEVQTSIMRCWASASSVIDSELPAGPGQHAGDREVDQRRDAGDGEPEAGILDRAAASPAGGPPRPTMPMAAIRMSAPSKPLEKYSALVWP